MRLDVLSVFPGFFDVLDLSLLGKARRDGVIDLHIHDLRTFTHDRHRTVDDTPYGGGPGMLMRPEPWGEALEHVVASGSAAAEVAPLLLVPTPAGRLLTQQLAAELAGEPWLAFACGRYEGIDQRVVEHAKQSMRVVEVSIGDYVLNGGEVAALVVIEAVVRLIPGVLGNQESLLDESHAAGLLEAPGYTKPPLWQGLAAPEVLLSGNHGVIARWRREESLLRTARVRPDLIAALDPAELDDRDRELLAAQGWLVSGGRFSRSRPPVAD